MSNDDTVGALAEYFNQDPDERIYGDIARSFVGLRTKSIQKLILFDAMVAFAYNSEEDLYQQWKQSYIDEWGEDDFQRVGKPGFVSWLTKDHMPQLKDCARQFLKEESQREREPDMAWLDMSDRTAQDYLNALEHFRGASLSEMSQGQI